MKRKLLAGLFLAALISWGAAAQENPSVLFTGLLEKYKNTEYESKPIEGGPEDGMGIAVFDINKKMSKDLFCQFTLYTSMGQTQYFIYCKDGENIWYFHKKVLFYEEPYTVEDAEIQNTYFRYTDGLPYAFNDATGEYDIRSDTNEYPAFVDVGSLAQLIDIIQNAID